ncbi:hypothetical protein [Eubacterium ramulus]|jgi:hypothetical protein
MMEERKKILSMWIGNRVKDNEIAKCMFDITVPKLEETLYENEHIKKVCAMLDKYGIKHMKVDTIPGSFNLDRDWIETDSSTPIECAIEYPGAYPINWDIEDVVMLEKMDQNGDIIIRVMWITEDGKLVQNH